MRADYFCPDCERLLVTTAPRRLKDRYYCPSCDKLVKAEDLIRKGSITSMLGANAPSSGVDAGPPPTFLGSASFYDEGATNVDLTISDLTVSAGQVLVLCIQHVDPGTAAAGTVAWNSIDFGTPPDSHSSSVAAPSPSGLVGIHTLDVSVGATSDLVYSFGAGVISAVGVAFVLNDCDFPSQDGFSTLSFGSGTGTTPTTNLNEESPPQSSVISIAVVGVSGPESDSPGSWTNGFTRLTREGTEGATAAMNSTVDVAYKFINSLAAISVGKTGMTSRGWGVQELPFRR